MPSAPRLNSTVQVCQDQRPGRWEIHDIQTALSSHDDWDVLAESTSSIPMAESWWMRCWWKHFAPPGETLFVHRLLSADSLKAVIPLAYKRGLVRAQSWPCNPHTPLVGIPLSVEPVAAFSSLLEHLKSSAEYLELPAVSVDAGDGVYASLVEVIRRSKLPFIKYDLPGSSYLDYGESWPALRSSLSRNIISTTERHHRQLSRMGRLQVCRITRRTELDAPLQECFALEMASWKGVNRSAMASKPATLGFYTDLAKAAADAGALSLYTLRLDGKLIAFDYSLTRRGIVYLLKLSYDAALAKYSPSNVLLRLRLQDEIENRTATRYDFGIASAWKLRWTRKVSRVVFFRIYLDHPRARTAYYLGPALRSRIKSLPFVAQVVGSIREARNTRKQARHARLRGQVRDQAPVTDELRPGAEGD